MMFALQVSLGEMTPVNDISTWQEASTIPGDIDFTKLATKSRGVMIKRSQAARADQDGARNYERSKGIIRRGGYHYLDWTKTATDQADYFWSQLQPEIGELAPWLDYEEWSGAPYVGTARQFLHDVIERMNYHLVNAGWNTNERPLVIYTSPGYWAQFGSADAWWLLCDLAIAHYYVSRPSIPRPWGEWRYWQYSDKGDGLAHGVESLQIDMDWYNGSADDFYAYALPMVGETPPPQPPPEAIMQEYKVVSVDGLNLRTAPNTGATIKAVWPYGGVLVGTGRVSAVTGVEAWVEIKHPTFGPLWAALVYGGKRYLVTL